jgi:hypothetical protein
VKEEVANNKDSDSEYKDSDSKNKNLDSCNKFSDNNNNTNSNTDKEIKQSPLDYVLEKQACEMPDIVPEPDEE